MANILIKDVPEEVRDMFKAECARFGISMRKALINYMFISSISQGPQIDPEAIKLSQRFNPNTIAKKIEKIAQSEE